MRHWHNDIFCFRRIGTRTQPLGYPIGRIFRIIRVNPLDPRYLRFYCIEVMIIKNKIGNLASHPAAGRQIDWLCLEWYETNKRIQRKKTQSGREISLKFMNENPGLTQGDILFKDQQLIIAVDVLPCDCLIIYPKDMKEMASVCYEIGNKHLPLFFESNSLLVPFEQPLYRLLTAQGYEVKQDKRKILYPIKTTVSPHAHGNESLFSKIMKLTASNE